MIRSRCPMFLRGAAALTVAGLVLPALAPAQQLRFEQKKYRANPGDTVELKLFAEGAGAISGLNFALRISSEDAAQVRLQDATSFTTLPGATFRYTDNRLTRTATESGLVTGDVQELRGVLYSHRVPASTINTSTAPRHLVSVFLPVSLTGAGRVFLELVNDEDNGVALLGMANAEGNAVDNVRGDMATIVIERVGLPQVTDFREPRTWTGWRFGPIMPDNGDPLPIGQTVPGVGLRTVSIAPQSFGSWEFDLSNRGAWNTPTAGNLLVTDWEMTSTHAGEGNPPFRLRKMTTNAIDVSEIVLQDLAGDPRGINATPGPEGRVYRTIIEAPTFSADNTGLEGISPFVDLMGFDDFGRRPGQLTLASITQREFDPALLRGRRTEYYQNFGTRDGGGWMFESGLSGGIEATFSRGRNGLGITSGGPAQSDPNRPFGLTFSAGFWFAPFEVINVAADPNRWYRLEADVVGTFANPLNAPVVRLRVFPQGSELFFTSQHFAGIDVDDEYVSRLDSGGRTMNLWFQVPEQWAGLPLTMAFDMYQIGGESTGPDANPSVYMRWVRLTSFDKPDFGAAR